MIKFTVSGLQGYDILKQADEISVQYRNYKYLIDLIKRYEDKTFIVKIPAGTGRP